MAKRVRREFEPAYYVNPGEKPDPPPGPGTPKIVRQVWDASYKPALRYYKTELAPDPEEIARATAWRTVDVLGFRKNNGTWVRVANPQGTGAQVGVERFGGQAVHLGDPPERIPTPNGVTFLGKLLEINYIDGAGRFVIQKWDGPMKPDLVWKDEMKVLMAFPGVGRPEECIPISPQLQAPAHFLSRWAKRRKAECAWPIQVPAVNVAPVGAANTIVYRSDKFDGKKNPHPDLEGSGEYIHTFGEDVFVDEGGIAKGRRKGSGPAAVLISGGKMDVEERGIIY